MTDRPSLKSRLKNYFITGLLVLIPIGLTIYILRILIKLVERLFPFHILPFYVPGLGIIITVGIVLATGFVATSVIGRWLGDFGENLLYRIPVVKNIYTGAKQLSKAIFAPKGEKFRSVVLIEYPRRGIYSMGFVTGTTRGAMQDLTEKEMINIFVPTTPNPTSGFYLMVPADDIIKLDMNVEDAFKVLISGGLYYPPNNKFNLKENDF
ncbi:MAG: DUF502 domain-containing protein [Deltaproteobacteria bacterium]|nr:DUF502 domain-containing protein [Deltaproteobacteria bacterium]